MLERFSKLFFVIVNNFYCSDPLCSEGALVSDIDAKFSNTIVVGSANDEILLVNAVPDLPEIDFKIEMQNCVVQVDELLNDDRFPNFFPDICVNCVPYEFGDTLFVDPELFDFHLDTLSLSRDLDVLGSIAQLVQIRCVLLR